MLCLRKEYNFAFVNLKECFSFCQGVRGMIFEVCKQFFFGPEKKKMDTNGIKPMIPEMPFALAGQLWVLIYHMWKGCCNGHKKDIYELPITVINVP